MSRTNLMKQKLKNGESVFGTWSMLGSAAAVNAMGEAGLDFVVLDMEHGPMTVETVQYQMYAAEAAGCTPIARLGKYDDLAILRVLDAGAQARDGLPHRHLGRGRRRGLVRPVHPSRRPGACPRLRAATATPTKASPRSSTGPMRRCSSACWWKARRASTTLRPSATCRDLDMVYLGIYDISQALGVPGQVNHPSVLEVVEKSVKLIRDKGCIAGTVARDTTYLKNMVDWGFQFVSYRVDCAILRDGFVEMRETFDGFRSGGGKP